MMRPAVELLGIDLEGLEELKNEAESAMVEASHGQPISRLLETVPGLRRVRVAQIVSIVVTAHRFQTKRQFWAYRGLGVVSRCTSDWVHVDGQWFKARFVLSRGLNRNFKQTPESVIKGAATTMTGHSKPNRLREANDRLPTGDTKPNLAKLTITRKMAASTPSMWKSGEEYDRKR